jgi:hypothetical protein
MKSFIDKAKRITEIVILITGFVAALAAAMEAFSATMGKHYNTPGTTTPNNEGNTN